MRATHSAPPLALIALGAGLFGCGAAMAPAPPPPQPSGALKGAKLIPTRSCLVGGTREESGFGAYSYLLLNESPKGSERDQALLRAYAERLTETAAAGDLPREMQNVTYAPTRGPCPVTETTASWLIENYDANASRLMLRAQGLNGVGPYIVTATRPLSAARAPLPVGVIDLSRAPGEAMEPWVRYFIRVSNEPEHWVATGATKIVLAMHDFLDMTGQASVHAIASFGVGGKILTALGVIKGP